MAASPIPLATYTMNPGSMRPTFEGGDWVAADTLKGICGLGHPNLGDVVVYLRNQGRVPYVARLVAGPGQTFAMVGGVIVIDGKPVRRTVVGEAPFEGGSTVQVIRETLQNGKSYLTLDAGPGGILDNIPVTRLPADGWYLLGDNRDNAADSRLSLAKGGAGIVSSKRLCGTLILIIDAKDKTHVGRRP